MACNSISSLTGRLGKLVINSTNKIKRVTQWAVAPKLATTSEWGDSDGEGYTLRAAGRRDCTFTAEGKFDTDDEIYAIFQPGDMAEAALWMNASLYWYFPRALNSEFGLAVNVDTEEVIGWTSQWGADGCFYYPGQTGTTAQTIPADA